MNRKIRILLLVCPLAACGDREPVDLEANAQPVTQTDVCAGLSHKACVEKIEAMPVAHKGIRCDISHSGDGDPNNFWLVNSVTVEVPTLLGKKGAKDTVEYKAYSHSKRAGRFYGLDVLRNGKWVGMLGLRVTTAGGEPTTFEDPEGVNIMPDPDVMGLDTNDRGGIYAMVLGNNPAVYQQLVRGQGDCMRDDRIGWPNPMFPGEGVSLPTQAATRCTWAKLYVATLLGGIVVLSGIAGGELAVAAGYQGFYGTSIAAGGNAVGFFFTRNSIVKFIDQECALAECEEALTRCNRAGVVQQVTCYERFQRCYCKIFGGEWWAQSQCEMICGLRGCTEP